MKKINQKNIFIIILCLILLGCSIFVGSPIKNNTDIINLIVLLIFIIYVAIKLVKDKKYKIIRNKLDIFIAILVFSSYIALIFQNYSNLEATIEYIIKYNAILSIYIMIRDLVAEEPRYKNYIINTLCISSISIFLLGLDNLTFNFLENFIELTNNVNVLNEDKRFLGIFGYANTTSILMLIISIISIGKYIKEEDSKKQLLYNLVVFINIVTIIMSYSRSVWIIALIAYIIYFIILKEKAKYIEILFRTGILSTIYGMLAIKFITQNNFQYVWLLLIVFLILTVMSYLPSEKITKIIKKIKIRYYIILSIVMMILIVVVWNVGTRMTEPLILFNDVNINAETTKDIKEIKPNTTYNFEFEIDAKTAYTDEEIYTIAICERNKYDDILKTHEINIGNFSGIKNIEFTTSEYTYKILIKFQSSNRIAQRGLTINSLKINNNVEPLKYKFLPTKIVDKIKDISLSTISVTERAEYMKDACKLIGKYGILGIGADGWKDRQAEVQEYYNYANEIHSYILEVFCEFGIVGFIGLVGIIIEICILAIKTYKKNDIINISIILALSVLILHSFMDFELSFMYMLVVLFSLIACVNEDDKKYHNINIIGKILVIISIIISMYFALNITINKYIKDEENPYSVEYISERINTQEDFSKNIDELVNRRKYMSHIDIFEELIMKNRLNEEEYIKLFDVLKDEEIISQNNASLKMQRIYMFIEIMEKIDNSKEKQEECKSQILHEIQSANELLENPEKCRLSFDTINEYKEELKEFEKEVQKLE